MRYFIGADLGTSALKLLLCANNGEIMSSVSKTYEVCYPKPDWSEQNPLDWWRAFREGVADLTVDIDKTKISAIAVAGQMHGLVMLDSEDNVIRPAILWNDGRSSKETDFLNYDIGKRALLERTANIAFCGFTAPKLLWVKENEPDNFNRIRKIMLPKDYINYRLTGNFATDCSDASGLLLLDVKNRKWSEEMLDVCGIREEQLPRLFESYEFIGNILPSVARELGLCEGTAVAAGAGDNACAAVGTGTVGTGKCNISLGTSGTVFVSSENFVCDYDSALHYFCHADGKYHIMGCMLSAASCNKWFCNNLLKTDDYEEVQKNISDADLGKNDVYFLPYLMGERSPINDSDATGVFIGLRPNTTREDMALAILEGVSFAIRDNLDIIKNMGINIKASTVTGGGSKSALWLKILANVLNIELQVPENEQGPALGAAYLAAVACGEYKDLSEVPRHNIKTKILPSAELSALYEQRYAKFRMIYPNMKKLFREMKKTL